MIRSMTAFASTTGEMAPFSWSWELRSVNAKGLDVRARVPDWLDGLEAWLRAELAKALGRGNVNVALRVTRQEDAGHMRLNPAALDGAMAALAEVEARAMAQGISLAPSRASDLLALRGVMEAGLDDVDTKPLQSALRAQVPDLIAAFLDMRTREGAALAEVLLAQIGEVARLTEEAAALADARKAAMAETLRGNLRRVLDNADGADEDRVAQELAMLAVKADVTEEIDRLRAHVTTARALLETGGPVGRKLDFLMQEFNREANTLCSKAQFSDLTAVGLDLKATIDQMREQVQNIE